MSDMMFFQFLQKNATKTNRFSSVRQSRIHFLRVSLRPRDIFVRPESPSSISPSLHQAGNEKIEGKLYVPFLHAEVEMRGTSGKIRAVLNGWTVVLKLVVLTACSSSSVDSFLLPPSFQPALQRRAFLSISKSSNGESVMLLRSRKRHYHSPSSSASSTTRSSLQSAAASPSSSPRPSSSDSVSSGRGDGNGSAASEQQRTKDPVDTTQNKSQKDSASAVTSASSVMDLPWSEMRAWALRDAVPKHKVQVVARNGSLQSFVLWRNLCQDTAEITGYPLDFVVERYKEQRRRDVEASDDSKTAVDGIDTMTTILPYLDDFEFEPTGGVRARVYGVQGVADGSPLQTAAVAGVERTLPQRYVCTADGSVVYELGNPKQDAQPIYSLDGTTKMMKEWKRKRTESPNMEESSGALAQVDPELLQLGGLTALLIGGAIAVEALSHHLTINVFWV
jgi:hypothetical protein